MDEELSNKIMTILSDNKNLSQAEAESILSLIKQETASIKSKPVILKDDTESLVNKIKMDMLKTNDFREKARLAAMIISLREY